MPFMRKIKAMSITLVARSKALVFTRECVKRDALFRDREKPAEIVVCKNHVRDCLVIKHALSLFRVTRHVSSSRLLRVTQTCWYKRVDFQQLNINLLMLFLLKYVIDLVIIHPAVYQSDRYS